MEKMAWDGPKWGREDFFPANPGLANILGRTDLIFENFYFFHFLDPKFWISRSQNSGFPKNLAFPASKKSTRRPGGGGRGGGGGGGGGGLGVTVDSCKGYPFVFESK